MAINMWPWHEFKTNDLMIHFNIFLRVFVQYLLCQEKFIGKKTCAIVLSSPPPFLQKAFQETYSWWLFLREGLLGWTLNTRDQCSLGSLQEAWFASWLITGLKRLTTFGFIARSGYNFLVVITRLKRLTAFGFIARSGHNFLVVITEQKGGDSFVVHCL